MASRAHIVRGVVQAWSLILTEGTDWVPPEPGVSGISCARLFRSTVGPPMGSDAAAL